jgi:hypothetical protein
LQPALQVHFPDHSVFTDRRKLLGEIRRSDPLQRMFTLTF